MEGSVRKSFNPGSLQEAFSAICGVFAEVTPAMNCCMQMPLATNPHE
jgi:hypothetical protein